MQSCAKLLLFASDVKHIAFYQTRSVDTVQAGRQLPSMLAKLICPRLAWVHEIYVTPSKTQLNVIEYVTYE